ncbi:beta-galactosidase [Oculatella sp. FACHB-28]|uniref:beta-galactosidase n=1 Tax=Cyanophyceae TaxID=3028117 RepID=UPI00168579F7|nr:MULTISPECIES: beta-galactosidase [Cyanophyceae]MBD1866328.1 beta-galactosidase [Cyanobacteria bacterium FACHB-471]MBD1998562.1 beta-galactosidase [Leptolyngbya sp. FACHB-541]MBD2057076.1 beta-galactosidase [Oculatella sp. FACHB-28]MBD2071435.1 beta-galactosidase [Leptolyngbya sp. FACHB-671]
MALSVSTLLGFVVSDTGKVVALPYLQQLLTQSQTQVGTTFSQLQCQYINLNYQEAFRQICSLGLKRIRLCSYWHEIEPLENSFDFTTLDWLLDESHRHGIEVILTVGMKAPRWPEFHFPSWLAAQQDTSITSQPVDHNAAIANYTLRFIQKVIEHTRDAPNLKYWQIENEPFTRLAITSGRYLSYEFVRQEVELARTLALPRQKLLLTNAITLPDAGSNEDDRAFQESLSLADAVGINVYTQVPDGNLSSYLQPSPAYWYKLNAWQQQLSTSGKEAWVSEAQAEPWEPNHLVALDAVQYPSSSPQQTSGLVNLLVDLGYRTILLWGCEYWYWHQQNGRDRWWNTIEQLSKAPSQSIQEV